VAGDEAHSFEDDNAGPLLAEDLVNLDFPEWQEFKEFRSNWATYERNDFNIGTRASERLLFGAVAVLNDFRARPRFYVVNFMLTVLVGVLRNLLTDALTRALESFLFRSADVQQLSPVVILLVQLVFGSLLLISAIRTFMNGVNTAAFVIPSLPVSARDLALRVNRYLTLWRQFVPLAFFNAVRPIWLGGGQIQFGCGTRGISAENDKGMTYLLRWGQVDLIYDGDDPSELPFDEVHGVPLRVPPNNAVNPNAPFAAALSSLQTIAASTWAPASIKVRLFDGDELVIPKRFFEAREPWRWEDFLRGCWDFKFFSEGPAIGKSTGRINALQ